MYTFVLILKQNWQCWLNSCQFTFVLLIAAAGLSLSRSFCDLAMKPSLYMLLTIWWWHRRDGITTVPPCFICVAVVTKAALCCYINCVEDTVTLKGVNISRAQIAHTLQCNVHTVCVDIKGTVITTCSFSRWSTLTIFCSVKEIVYQLLTVCMIKATR